MSAPAIEARRLEPVTARAWRAAVEDRLGEWRLNASAGFSGRINACWADGDPGLPLDEAIGVVESWFGARRIAARFKLAGDPAQSRPLQDRLASRGYAPTKPTLVMIGQTSGRPDGRVRLSSNLDARFLSVFRSASADPGDAQERLDALARTPTPRAFALATEEGSPAAIGACAIEAPYVGIFAMRTHPSFRRRGLARAVLEALLEFAVAEGASTAWLQVEADNASARRLYDSAGFVEAYRYVYWMRGGAQ